ncbi:hypothetical protein V502_00217 [Pseudogymnoascus sp. VKM F-4520 (FW-2644)]|nr:hypothetical protein V502_00217 [Pseudogymnoascus sp. VKM F-4520 (FW-2644)]
MALLLYAGVEGTAPAHRPADHHPPSTPPRPGSRPAAAISQLAAYRLPTHLERLCLQASPQLPLPDPVAGQSPLPPEQETHPLPQRLQPSHPHCEAAELVQRPPSSVLDCHCHHERPWPCSLYQQQWRGRRWAWQQRREAAVGESRAGAPSLAGTRLQLEFAFHLESVVLSFRRGNEAA